ncbi:MAG TPA: hypothetical protein VJ691_15265 [Vicinamibacterales bacterium]|nr:hypothetical protein [Vicinamibacterales bacterium]
MTRRAVLFALFVVLPGIAIAQQGSASPIDGVWRITEITTSGANVSTNKSPQPSLLIFSRGHYSWIHVAGTTPRKERAAAATPGKLTDAEKIAAHDEWQPLTANAGTFEVKGTTLTRRLMVAKNVAPMAPTANPVVQEFKIDGSTLTLTGPSGGDPKTQIRYTLTRVR